MKNTLALALVLAAAPFAAPAAELSYSFVEGGLTQLHVDEAILRDPELNGGYVRGSFDLGSGFNLIGSVGRVSDDIRPVAALDLRVDLELTQYEFGAGYHMGLSERVDFIAELAAIRINVDVEGEGDHATGGRGAIGIRGAFNDRVEAHAKVNYYDAGDFEGGVSGALGAQFRITPMWGITAEVEHGELVADQDTRYSVGVRASF